MSILLRAILVSQWLLATYFNDRYYAVKVPAIVLKPFPVTELSWHNLFSVGYVADNHGMNHQLRPEGRVSINCL
jgi:hypothetical protein